MNKRYQKCVVGFVLVLVLCLQMITAVQVDRISAAKKATLVSKKISMQVGNKKNVKVKNKKKGAKYTFKSNKKKVVTVSAKGTVTAKAKGSAIITVKEKAKKKVRTVGKVKVTVTKKTITVSDTPVTTPSQTPSQTTVVTPSQAPSQAPSENPTATPEPSAAMIYSNYFEDGELNGFGARGSATLEVSNSQNYTDGGRNSLSVGGRSASWHGAQMDLGSLVKLGNEYRFSVWVKQDSSATEKISMKLQYTDSTGTQYKGIVPGGEDGIDCPSGEWIHLEGSYTIPADAQTPYLYFECPSSETLGFFVDDVEIYGEAAEITGFVPSDDVYEQMKTNSVLSTGNNAKIKNVIAKARAGEDVTLAYIGGSITEGANASPNSKCYVSVNGKAFADKYGTGSNVHFVNAGMSGTPSTIGVVRYDRDVVGQMTVGTKPDILFIEFAVNDYGEVTNGGAYEGLIRHALKNGTAVVLIFSVFQSGRVLESSYIPYGTYYNLPMISMGDSIQKYFNKDGFYKWFFSDTLHPNATGYKLMSDCIMTMFDKIDLETTETDNITDINDKPAKTSDAYENIHMLDASTDITSLSGVTSVEPGSFAATDSATGTFQYKDKNGATRNWFPNNYMHNANGGSDSFKATINCSTFMVVYKLSSETAFGSADLYVDGVKKQTLAGYSSSGWNNGQTAVVTGLSAKSHEIEIRMTDNSKKFTILAMGY